MLPDAMSIFARSTRAPLGNSPARIRANRSRFSSTAPVAERAVPAGLGQRAARQPDLLLRLVIDIGLARANQVLRPGIKLLEVIRRIVKVLAPIEAKPADVALDRIDILLLLLRRIGVVKAEIATSAEFLGNAEIQADRFGVPEMQIAVRLRREPGDDTVVLSGREVAATISRMKSRPASAVNSSVIVCLSSCAYVPNPQAPAKGRDVGRLRDRHGRAGLADLFRNENRTEQPPH